jgi:hypothetical protein
MEKIKAFSEISVSDLEESVHAWIQAQSGIEIIDRQFSTCVVGNLGEYAVYHSYLIVYRESVTSE